jgi:cytochrome c oxidase subunit 2
VVAQNEDDFQSWVQEMSTPAPTANAPDSSVSTADSAVTPAQSEDVAAAGVEEDALVARGRQVFFQESYCVLCHAIEGTAAAGQIGPNLTRIGSRSTIGAGMLENTPENLERWIRDPRLVKPGVQMPGAQHDVTYEGQTFPPTNLNDEQIRALAAWLSSMK